MGNDVGFENLGVWKDARNLTRQIYLKSATGPWGKDYSLREQIRRACISVISNIAEGYERGGDNEFHQLLYQAKASAGEIRAQLFIGFDLGYLNEVEFNELREKVLNISRQLSGLMKYLKHSSLQGSKYRK